ncbi:hypothetical protein CPB83DRAFT_764831 [Crepidotus variabilis]|uniref:Uncharacterized protein n=1 Tax=Crepidotus variabilis TaxID=179855 RepID=A0A9P6EIR3_9AGAR|nr:hypothetical protein CPB83DRAFT_764831 [Crepidotus variabilis]
MVCHTAGDLAQREQFYHLHEISAHPKLPRFEKLLQSWDSFIETTVREWKSLNIVSTLLLTAILTVLQIPGLGDYRPIRYTALVALKCALMSMIFGVAFVIQFSSMRRRYIAAEWALVKSFVSFIGDCKLTILFIGSTEVAISIL